MEHGSACSRSVTSGDHTSLKDGDLTPRGIGRTHNMVQRGKVTNHGRGQVTTMETGSFPNNRDGFGFLVMIIIQAVLRGHKDTIPSAGRLCHLPGTITAADI